MKEFRKLLAPLSRRRFITISAVACGLGFAPARASSWSYCNYSWRGVAMGAEASLTLQHQEETAATAAIADCLNEVARLEAMFSLHRPDSALSRLNRDGSLAQAPGDLRILLAKALRLAERSRGAFDPTIQPLWQLYARHFALPNASPDGPREADIERARQLAGWQDVRIEESSIRFARKGMAVTLNGIAQGYVTDKVGEVLRSRGFEHVLVNMGEQLTLGPKSDGSAWHVGIADPNSPARTIEQVALSSGAVATSSRLGLNFDPSGRFAHILDPHTGRPAQAVASVTVLAPRATEADGLSTALAVLPPSEFPRLLDKRHRAYVVATAGSSGAWIGEARQSDNHVTGMPPESIQ